MFDKRTLSSVCCSKIIKQAFPTVLQGCPWARRSSSSSAGRRDRSPSYSEVAGLVSAQLPATPRRVGPTGDLVKAPRQTWGCAETGIFLDNRSTGTLRAGYPRRGTPLAVRAIEA